MLRQAALRAATAFRASDVATRGFTTRSAALLNADEVEAPATEAREAFLKKWLEVAPSTQDPPDFFSELLGSAGPGPIPDTVPAKMKFNFFLPHALPYKAAEVDMVLVPSVSGDFGVLPGHVPTVAQLKPGTMTVHTELDKDVKKYFVSSGFAFVHANSTCDVVAVEAVPLEDLDLDMVKSGLAEYTGKVVSAKDDYERATAQIGVEVYSAMQSALE
mmetsp:Transcript_24319/g.76604  ORF Transcript_24319/g.76604 Transcript_24319/m.76604 type:complete len:217 (-) Transcript_24319:156-806(-)